MGTEQLAPPARHAQRAGTARMMAQGERARQGQFETAVAIAKAICTRFGASCVNSSVRIAAPIR